MKRTLLALLFLSLAGCLWRGVDDLGVSDAELVVVVTGTQQGDRVLLEVDENVTRLDATDEPEVRLYVRLDAGEHDVELRHVRAGILRCTELEVEIVPGATSVWSVDVRLLPVCSPDEEREPDQEAEEDAGVDDAEVDAGEADEEEGDPDAGASDGEDTESDGDAGEADGPGEDAGVDGEEETELVRLREVSTAEECSDGCALEETRIESDGSAVYVDADGVAHTAVLTPAELAAVVADTLSAAADLLFDGEDDSCPVAQPSGPAVELERRLRVVSDNEESFTTERIDVSECGGIAAALREHLASARDRALGDDGDAGP